MCNESIGAGYDESFVQKSSVLPTQGQPCDEKSHSQQKVNVDFGTFLLTLALFCQSVKYTRTPTFRKERRFQGLTEVINIGLLTTARTAATNKIVLPILKTLRLRNSFDVTCVEPLGSETKSTFHITLVQVRAILGWHHCCATTQHDNVLALCCEKDDGCHT